MPVAAGTPTVVVDSFNIFEAIVPLTLSGSYPGTAAGDPLDLSKIGIPSNSVPLFVDIKEAPPAGTLPSGISWNFAPGTTQANGALQALVGGSSAGTVASTSTAPTVTTLVNASTANPVAVTGGALTSTTGETGVTGVQAPTITSTFTGSSSGGAGNLGNVTYASVSAANLVARVVYRKFL